MAGSYPRAMAGTTAVAADARAHEPAFTPPPSDWLLRPFEAAPFSPVWLGAVIAILFAAVSLAGRLLIGEGGDFLGPDGRIRLTYVWVDLLNGVIFAYIPTALVILRRGTVRDLHALRPSLRCTDAEFQQIVTDVTCIPAQRLLVLGMAGAVLFALMPVFDPTFFEDGQRALGDPLLLFFMLRSALTGWLGGHAVATEVHSSRAYSALGEARVEVDLLDTRPLHSFARKGMRSVLTWIVCISLVSLFWLGPAAASANGPIVLGITALLLYSLFHSISGVHRSIRRTKDAQLDTLRERIRAERGALLDSQAEHAGDGARLAGLIAYYDLVERVAEWPFDASMALRLALLVTLGVGSWLGGALVERLLEAWL